MRIHRFLLAAAALACGAARAQSDGSGLDGNIEQLPPADVSVTLTDGLKTVLPGQTVRWTLTVNNVDISGLVGVVVTTALSSNLTQVTWTCRATTGSECTSNGFGTLTDSIDIASRGNVRYSITAIVAPDATPAGYIDLTPDNNRATDTDTVYDAELIFVDDFDP